MRAVTTTLSLTVLSLTAVSLLLTAPMALASEGDTSSAEGFGSGQWDGLILAFVAGLVIGVTVLVTVGGQPAPRHHGDDAVHGDDALEAG